MRNVIDQKILTGLTIAKTHIPVWEAVATAWTASPDELLTPTLCGIVEPHRYGGSANPGLWRFQTYSSWNHALKMHMTVPLLLMPIL